MRRIADGGSRTAVLAALSLTLVLVGCGGGGDGGAERPARSPSPSSRTGPAALVEHVLAISVDGLTPRALRVLGPRGAPALHELEREGAGTRNARTAYELTVTLPNHTGMLTGRPVDPARGGHGVVVNDDSGTTVHDAAGEQVDSVFDVVREAGGSTALFTAKAKFGLYDRTWPEGIDRFAYEKDTAALVELAVADLLGERRAFTFLHLSAPDVAGHAHGWMSRPYLDAVREADRALGRLLDAADADPGLSSGLAVLLTSDHGGRGPTHTDPTRPADYTVPFLVRGPGVPAGADLYDLNPQLADPGAGRPSYDGPQPVRNGDLANLATDLLGLGPVPGSTFDAAQDVEVTGP